MINVIFVIVIIKYRLWNIKKRLIDKNFQIKEFLFDKI